MEDEQWRDAGDRGQRAGDGKSDKGRWKIQAVMMKGQGG